MKGLALTVTQEDSRFNQKEDWFSFQRGNLEGIQDRKERERQITTG